MAPAATPGSPQACANRLGHRRDTLFTTGSSATLVVNRRCKPDPLSRPEHAERETLSALRRDLPPRTKIAGNAFPRRSRCARLFTTRSRAFVFKKKRLFLRLSNPRPVGLRSVLETKRYRRHALCGAPGSNRHQWRIAGGYQRKELLPLPKARDGHGRDTAHAGSFAFYSAAR
jgi:hypothetical protein